MARCVLLYKQQKILPQVSEFAGGSRVIVYLFLARALRHLVQIYTRLGLPFSMMVTF